jgi:dUTP pyrophosphatase
MIQVKFRRISPDATVPTKAHASDSGFDLTAVSEPFVGEDGYLQYHTGIALELPEGYEGQIRPRSSISKYDLVLANGGPGTIDESYRGEIIVRFKPVDRFAQGPFVSGLFPTVSTQNIDKLRVYHKGDRIAQLVIVPVPRVELIEVENLSETARGTGGFGSSGT